MSSFVLQRTWMNDKATLGQLYACDGHGTRVIAHTLEDPAQEHKITGRTRIPQGNYKLQLRTHGKWAQRFQEMGFSGSNEILGVENFTDALIHWGNTDGDTSGCVLLGLGSPQHW